MKISIIENESGLTLASYEIDLSDLHHQPSDEEYFSKAWVCAVEKGIVDDENSSQYRCVFTASKDL